MADPLAPSPDIGTPSEPGGPGQTEYPMPEPGEGDIYVPSLPDIPTQQ